MRRKSLYMGMELTRLNELAVLYLTTVFLHRLARRTRTQACCCDEIGFGWLLATFYAIR